MNIATTCTDRKTMARGLAEHLEKLYEENKAYG